MCGRFSIDFDLLFETGLCLSSRTDKVEYFPGMEIYHRGEEEEYSKGVWGIEVDFMKGKIINSRTEKIYTSKFFLDDFIYRRCIIPASSFYEWRKRGEVNTKYEIKTKTPFFYLAGLYRLNSEGVRTLSVLTTKSFGKMGEIHSRAPVVLHPGQEESFLKEDPESLIKKLVEQRVDFRISSKGPEQITFI